MREFWKVARASIQKMVQNPFRQIAMSMVTIVVPAMAKAQ
jgi:hypothetical protein